MPGRVPIDLLQKLSVYDEDWYVEAPANAALKSMAASVREIMGIFFMRLHSEVADERTHAARNLLEIAEKEPEIIDREMTNAVTKHLRSISDRQALPLLQRILALLKKANFVSGYKYGL